MAWSACAIWELCQEGGEMTQAKHGRASWPESGGVLPVSDAHAVEACTALGDSIFQNIIRGLSQNYRQRSIGRARTS